MVDAERVRRRLKEIDTRLTELRTVQARGREDFLRDRNLQALAERHLQVALQAAIDIAAHVVAEDSADTPDDYASTMTILARESVVGQELGERLAAATRLRNVLVHAYVDIDQRRMWEALGNLDDLESFASAIEKYLER